MPKSALLSKLPSTAENAMKIFLKYQTARMMPISGAPISDLVPESPLHPVAPKCIWGSSTSNAFLALEFDIKQAHTPNKQLSAKYTLICISMHLKSKMSVYIFGLIAAPSVIKMQVHQNRTGCVQIQFKCIWARL
jgi:hypothetical protein